MTRYIYKHDKMNERFTNVLTIHINTYINSFKFMPRDYSKATLTIKYLSIYSHMEYIYC